MAERRVKALQVSQPIGEFYLCVMDHQLLIDVSASDIRRLRDNELDSYIGIQRRLNKNRMKDIVNYVNSFDATFPTAVILAIDDNNAQFDSDTLELILTDEGETLGEIATVLDGQHRIEGLKRLREGQFEQPVCIFIGADMHTKATIFATVNLAQTKVNRSLAYDLLDYEKLDSPQKVAHNVAVNLDRMEESPFKGRIKRLGVATEGRSRETLTQATIVEMLVDLFLSSDAIRDRNSLWERISRSELPDDGERYPFRSFYRGARDGDILANLINYFNAVAERYPNSWQDVKRKGNVLPKTNGFRALMRALREVYPVLKERTSADVPRSSHYRQFVDLIALEDDDFTTDEFPAGTSGEARMYNYLKEAIEELNQRGE